MRQAFSLLRAPARFGVPPSPTGPTGFHRMEFFFRFFWSPFQLGVVFSVLLSCGVFAARFPASDWWEPLSEAFYPIGVAAVLLQVVALWELRRLRLSAPLENPIPPDSGSRCSLPVATCQGVLSFFLRNLIQLYVVCVAVVALVGCYWIFWLGLRAADAVECVSGLIGWSLAFFFAASCSWTLLCGFLREGLWRGTGSAILLVAAETAAAAAWLANRPATDSTVWVWAAVLLIGAFNYALGRASLRECLSTRNAESC